MTDENWTAGAFAEATREFAARIFSDVRAISRSPAPLTGVTRTSYSPEEAAVLEHLAGVCRGLGLEVERDPAGNVWATLPGRDRTLPAVVSGSHVDSVPDGGNYDGLAGIAAALATARWMRIRGFTPLRDFRVVLMRGEEEGLYGSLGMRGGVTEADLGRRLRTGGPTLRELLERNGIDPQVVSGGKPVVDFSKMACFLETHIEQSARLDGSKDRRLGIVTGIRGLVRRREIRAVGETAHAGAVDFPFRRDAALACVRFSSKLYEAWMRELALGRDLVVTTGILSTPPSAAMNKIAGECSVSLDARSLSPEELDRVEEIVERLMREAAEETGTAVTADPVARVEPVVSDPELMRRLEASASALAVGCQRLPSGAGHDSMNFREAGVPFAMLFIANQNGSHNPNEGMLMGDFLEAAAVLARTVMDFDR